MYYVNGVGFVNGQFTRDDINYPKNWLSSLNEQELEEFGASKPPTYNRETHVLEMLETGWEVREKTQEELDQDEQIRQQNAYNIIQEKISQAWEAANAHANEIDQNSRTSILWLYSQPNIPEWQKSRIESIQLWWATIWEHYAEVKNKILNQEDVVYNYEIAGPAPYTIWQITKE